MAEGARRGRDEQPVRWLTAAEVDSWLSVVRLMTWRRFTNAILTDKGFQALAEAAPGHVAQVRSLVIDVLSAEQLRRVGLVGKGVNGAIWRRAGSRTLCLTVLDELLEQAA
jgi:hypothetical protein